MLFKFFSKLFKKELFKLKNRKISPGFWLCKGKDINFKYIYVDLRNLSDAHIGDQLFFISALGSGIPYNKKVFFVVNKRLNELYDCFNLYYLNEFDNNISENNLLLTSIKSYNDPIDDITQKFSNILLYDLTDNDIKQPLYQHIYESLFKLKKEEDLNKSIFKDFINLETTENYLIKDSYFVFNDITYSRSFLTKFLQYKLRKQLIDLKNMGYKIVYVGGINDKKFKSSLIQYVDIDLRGQTNFKKLIKIIFNNNCNGFIGFDNAIMHLTLLANKKAFVKFRGRITKKASELHYRSINCAVNKQAKDNIRYIQ